MQENYNVGIYARLSRDDERAGESWICDLNLTKSEALYIIIAVNNH